MAELPSDHAGSIRDTAPMRDRDRSRAKVPVSDLSDQTEAAFLRRRGARSACWASGGRADAARLRWSAGPPETPDGSFSGTSRPHGGELPAAVSQPTAQRMARRGHGDRVGHQLLRLLPHGDRGLPGSEPANLVSSPCASGQPVPGHGGDSPSDGDHRHPFAVGQALGRLSQSVLLPAQSTASPMRSSV